MKKMEAVEDQEQQNDEKAEKEVKKEAKTTKTSSRAAAAKAEKAEKAEKATKAVKVEKGGKDNDADEEVNVRKGTLDLLPDGFGFLRTRGYTQSDNDIYVSLSQIRRFNLRRGDEVTGQVREPKDSEKYNALLKIEAVNGMDPEEARNRPNFDYLTPLFPIDRLRLETESTEIATRVIDLIAPIGKGQRGLIVSPPKAGKTTILKNLANSITENHPDVYLLVRTGAGPGEAPGGVGARRRRAARQHHAAGARLQPDSACQRQDPLRRRRLDGAVPAEKVLRRCQERRGGRLPDDHCHCPRGYRQPHG